MSEKNIEKIYNTLTEENKEIINMLAKGMKIAQETGGTHERNTKINTM